MRRFLLLPLALLIFKYGQAQTWAQDVAPILYANCTSCHHPGGIGPFSLLTYSDAYNHAGSIKADVTSKTMPPWPPDPNYKHYVHERILTSAQIATIQNWVTAGSPQGNITVAPAQPTYNNNTQLQQVNLSVTIPTYTVGSNGDVYRNFPLPSGLASNMYVTAIEVVPGNAQIVHHVLVFQDTAATALSQLDANDPGPGYTDAGGTGSNSSVLIYGWAPGGTPYYTPVGTGFKLPANTRIVVQVHYPAGSVGQTDNTKVNFTLTSTTQRQINVVPILNHFTDMTNGPLSIPANQTKTFYEQYTIPANLTVLSALPHMHLIGQSITAWGNAPSTGDTIPLINIPQWNFHWQSMYPFQNALKISSGTVLHASAYYDNTTNNDNNPNSPPQTVNAGEATTDEMMLVFFAYLTYQTGDENLIIDRRVIPQGATTFCNGQSVVLNTIEGTGYTYQWYKDGATIGGQTTANYTATAAGNYYVKITLGPNNTFSDTIAVSVVSAPTATVTPTGSPNICSGNSVTLNASTGSGYTYQWFKDASPINGATGSTYAASSAGDYSVQVYNGCYANSSALTVSTANSPSATVTPSGATAFCQGSSVTLSAPAGLSYSWSTGATTQSIAASSTGSYVVTVSNGTCSATSTGTQVTVNALPGTTITNSGPNTFCDGHYVILTAPAGSSYLWSDGETVSAITVTQAASYTVTVTNSNNCSAASTPLTITVNPVPSAAVTAGGPLTFCEGGSVSLSASAGGLTYLWNTGATTQGLTVTQAGSYRVTVTNGNNCTAMSTNQVVTVNTLPNNSITNSGGTAFCSGQNVTLTAAPGLTYSWSNGATTSSISVVQTGIYTVTLTTNQGCTAASAPVNITVYNLPSATINASGATTFCSGGIVSLTAANNSSYVWSTGATTQIITATQNGSYSVTVTDAHSCSNTAVQQVTVYASPSNTVTNNNSLTICPGDNVTLTAAPGLSYQWSDGSTSQSVTVSANGTFTVTVTDNHSCTAVSSPQTVTVSNNAVAGVSPSGATTFCSGGSVQLNTITSGSSYLWSNGATTANISVTGAGTYVVTVTTGGSCIAISNPVTVVVNQNPAAPQISAAGNTTFCQGASVGLSAPAGYNYQWSNGATTQTITVSTAGSYSLTVADLNTCTAMSNTISVTVNNNPVQPEIAAGSDAFCAGSSTTIYTLQAGYDHFAWSDGSTANGLTVTTAGNYTLTVSDLNGCSAVSNTLSIAVNPLPTVAFTPTLNTLCSNASAWQVSGGNPAGGQYEGTGVVFGYFNPGISGLGTFAITYTYADNNGCSNTATGSITVTTCTGIDNLANNEVAITPNPCNGSFAIESVQPGEMAIFDLSGQFVYGAPLAAGKQEISLNNVAAACYMVQIKTGEQVYYRKLVVQ